nr:aminotransferase class V-fold PLP-dependent enzyme [Bacillus sp. ISL-47]
MDKKTKPARYHSFLPGPVPIHPKVKRGFSEDAISHRSEDFIYSLKNLRYRLCGMTGSAFAEVIVGTGTLANDLVAAQLKGDGLILANGEFGYRLIDHAKRFQLSFHTIEKEWNEPITLHEIDLEIRKNPTIKWIWTVHCETSTGYLYDIHAIQELCEQNSIELCVDACSTAGTVPLDLKNIYFASAVSGKGLGSYPGLAIVFHREKIKQNHAVPRYLDLKMYENHESIPYTHSSNLISALNESINLVDYEKTRKLAKKVRCKLKETGFELLGDDSYSPGILTIQLPMNRSSRNFGDRCKQKGILLSYESGYLLERNWVQVALMGQQGEEEVMEALDVLSKTLTKHKENRYEYV